MEVIPAINCEDEACVGKHLEMLRNIPAEWVHFDVSDGKFTPAVTWNEPEGLISDFGFRISDFSLEVHLMVEKPEEYAEQWERAGAKRVIMHLETAQMSNFQFPISNEYELGLAVLPETPVEAVYPYLDRVRFVQLLAVSPGFSGQKFQTHILKKIHALRERDASAIIEVDGGMSIAVASLVREAGANIVVSSSYIWNNPRPAKAFASLGRVS